MNLLLDVEANPEGYIVSRHHLLKIIEEGMYGESLTAKLKEWYLQEVPEAEGLTEAPYELFGHRLLIGDCMGGSLAYGRPAHDPRWEAASKLILEAFDTFEMVSEDE